MDHKISTFTGPIIHQPNIPNHHKRTNNPKCVIVLQDLQSSKFQRIPHYNHSQILKTMYSCRHSNVYNHQNPKILSYIHQVWLFELGI